MKVFMLSFVTAIVTSSGAFAYGPVMPMTIATIASEDGTKIEISSDGDVNLSEPGKSPRLLRTLSREALERFNKNQDGLHIAGALKAAGASSSTACVNPQLTTFSARGRNGKLQVIGSIDSCHDLVPSDESAQSLSMRDFLKAMVTVSANQREIGAR